MYLFWGLNLINQIKIVVITTCMVCMSFFSFAQSQNHNVTTNPSVALSYVELPAVPDSVGKEQYKFEAFQFAYPIPVSISLEDIAYEQRGDTLFYSLDIVSKGAYSLNLIFEDVNVDSQSYLSIMGIDSVDFRKYLASEMNQTGVLPTSIVSGDRITIQFVEPVDCANKSSWKITQVAHDYTGVFMKGGDLKAGKASSCNVDVNCSVGADWQLEKRAVCKLVVQGTTLCTGTLVNNTSKDNTPYVLTANHCISNATKALRTVFYFDYENERCGEASDIRTKSLSGSTLIATAPDGKVDFSLVQMNQVPPKAFNPYYAGWTLSENSVDKQTVCIHHPKGDVKKISIDNARPVSVTFKSKVMTYATEAHLKISKWDVGTTEGGSSGSSLFDDDHLIIGTLSGGEATCDNPVNDFFSKFSKAWDSYEASTAKLKPWLDPLNLGSSKCQGFDPYVLSPNQITNISPLDTLYLYDFEKKANGLWTSTNELGWTCFAERFVSNKSIYDIAFCGEMDKTQNLDEVQFCIWKGNQEPTEEVFSISMSEVQIKDSAWIYIPLNEFVPVDGVFWVGYKLENNSKAFSSYLSETISDGGFYVKTPQGWTSSEDIGFLAHLGVSLHATARPDTITSFYYEKPFFAQSLSDEILSKAPDELFVYDSLGTLTQNTKFYIVSSKTVSNWSAANEKNMSCFANVATNQPMEWLRGLKIAVSEIPNKNLKTDVVIWNGVFSEEIYRKPISNSDLKTQCFNQISFDSVLHVESSFSYGICYESDNPYMENLALYQYYDVESNIDGYFFTNGGWNMYKKYGVPYNVALQPIVVRNKYHFNPDKYKILYSPLIWMFPQTLSGEISCYVYPTICHSNIHIQFINDVASNVYVEIFDKQGHILCSDLYPIAAGEITVPTANLPSGCFSIKISTSEGTYIQRFIHLND